MLNAIIGKMGQGKSVLATYYALIAHRKKRVVYANYKLNFNYKPLHVNDMLKDGAKSALVIVDEADRYVSKMRANSNKVQETQNFLMQSRKKQIDIFMKLLKNFLIESLVLVGLILI